jgi:acetoacetate decarboxylase
MTDKEKNFGQLLYPYGEKPPSYAGILRVFFKLIGLKIKLWEEAEFLLVDVPLNEGKAKKLLPMMMFLRKPCRGTIFFANYPKTAFTAPYLEAALLIHVWTPLGWGVHCPWMVVNDDTAMIYGREILGYPKKMAEMNYSTDGKKIKADLSRRGVKILAVEAEKFSREERPEPVLGMKTFNIGGIFQIYSMNPVILFRPNETILESYKASARLELRDSWFDPIKEIIGNYRNPLDARIAKIHIYGSRFMLPVGLSGNISFKNSFNLRYR